jgi:hypothetical protein
VELVEELEDLDRVQLQLLVQQILVVAVEVQVQQVLVL